jgi:hypothetical protein
MRATFVVSPTLVLVLVGYPCVAVRAAEDAAEVAARTRQDAVKTLVMVYKRTEVVARGAESEAQEGPLKPKTTVPDKELTLESTNRLTIDGVKVRIEDNHPRWSMPDGTLLETRQVALCNGSIAKTFFSEGVRTGGRPTGYIMRDPRLTEVKLIALTPITLTIRGLEPAINPLPMSDMKPAGPALPIGGVPCQEYAIDYGHNSTVNCWLDPSKDYAVRRIHTRQRGKLVVQTDITSYRQEACGWVPASWVCNQFSPAGATLKSDKVQVLELQFNEPQSVTQFELQFPPGSAVGDGRNGKFYEVQPDGSMRETFSPTGEALSTWSVPQPGAPWYRRHQWLIVSVAVILAVAGILYAVRRRRGLPA